MNEVYINTKDLPEWERLEIYRNEELVSVAKIISIMEDLCAKIEELEDEIKRLTTKEEEDWEEF